MPTLTIEYRDEHHCVALEQVTAYVTELHQVAQNTPDGSVLDACEKLALSAAASGGVLNYFADYQDRLNYALRLRRGQSIGSGLVEGFIKQLLNKRLEQTGARWKVYHIGPLVELGG